MPDVIEAMEQLLEFPEVFDARRPWMAKALGKTAEQRKRFRYQEEALA